VKSKRKNIKLIALSKYKSVLEVKQTLFRLAKKRALKKGLEFSIELKDIHIPRKCPILKVPLICSTRYSPSIDRIYPNKGYVKDNIAVISTLQIAGVVFGLPTRQDLSGKAHDKGVIKHGEVICSVITSYAVSAVAQCSYR
jgi:hypothetical protein